MYVVLLMVSVFCSSVDHVFMLSFKFVNEFKNPVTSHATCNRTFCFGFYKKILLTKNVYVIHLRFHDFVV
jgi:hypothetical protein